MPVLHPTRRTLLGAFNLTTIRQGSDGMLIAFARSVAAQSEADVQQTAQDLGISRATTYRKMRRYGIVPSSLT